MSRTFRRMGVRHTYRWVLQVWVPSDAVSGLPGHWAPLDPRSPAGRKALARYHSDNRASSRPPRWFCRAVDHEIRTDNDRMLRRWLADPEFDPVFRAWHHHEACWYWY